VTKKNQIALSESREVWAT